MKKLVFVAASLPAMLLSSCAQFDWPEETMGGPGGFVKTVQVIPPRDVCDINAYINGYRSSYMLNWNKELEKRIDGLKPELERNPQDASTKARYDRYKSLIFDLKTINDKETRFGFVPSSVECEIHSNTLGQGHGRKDAAKDIDEL